MLGLGGYVFFSHSSMLLSEVREVKTPPAGRQLKHVVSHLPSVACVASCISPDLGRQVYWTPGGLSCCSPKSSHLSCSMSLSTT